MSDSIKSDYAELLNALSDMQQSPAYAVRRDVLAKSERAIVYLEEKVRSLNSAISDHETLRDKFAGKAMHAELATAGIDGPAADALIDAAQDNDQTIEERIAFNAYRLADAMLAERAK